MKPHSLLKVKPDDPVLCLIEALARAVEPVKTAARSAFLDIPERGIFDLLGRLEPRGYTLQLPSGR